MQRPTDTIAGPETGSALYATYRERYINEGLPMKFDLSKLLNEQQAIASAVRAIIFVGVAFGLDWTTEQIGQVMSALELILFLWSRAMVTPTHLANERMEEGRHPITGEPLPNRKDAASTTVVIETPAVNPAPDRLDLK